MFNPRITASQESRVGISVGTYVGGVQFISGPARLYSVTVTGLTVAVWAWIIDGLMSGSKAGPKHVLYVPAGSTGQLNWFGGSLFQTGITIMLNNAAPVDAATSGTVILNNTGMVSCEYAQEMSQ